MAVRLGRGGKKTLTASMKISVTDPNAMLRLRGRRQVHDWNEAWDYYDRIGEVHFALNEVGREMQRIEFVAQKLIKGIWETQPHDSPEAQLVDSIQSYNGGQGQVLKSYYLNSKVCGECWLVIYEKEDRTWFDICSPDEITVEETEQGMNPRVVRRSLPLGGVLSSPEMSVPEVLPEGTTLIRFWASHPRYSQQADSPLLALRLICEELDLLTKSTRAKILSRLVMAGILLWPNTISDVSGEAPTGDPTGMSDDPNIRKVINAMTFAIEHPDDPSGAMPIIVKGPGDELAKLSLLNFDRAILETDIHLRAELLERIIAGLDIHRETSQGSGESNHWCQGSESEACTRDRGWVTQEQLEVGDVILTLNHETGVSEWQPVLDIYRAEVVDEPMLSMESRSHSSLTTRGHRWPIIKRSKRTTRRWTTSADGFAGADRIVVAARCSNLPTEQKWSDDFVRLVAAFTSDGTITRSIHDGKHYGRQSVRIAKFQEREIIELRRILTSVFGLTGWSEHIHPTSTAVGVRFSLGVEGSATILDVTGADKVINLSFINDLTLAQCELLLASMIEIGDGIEQNGAITLYQVRADRLEAFALAATLIGRKVTRGRRSTNTGFGTEPLHWIRISQERVEVQPSSCKNEWIPYTGTIWCPTTDNGTFLTRHHGRQFFTGNSAWASRDVHLNVQVFPDVEGLCVSLTKDYYRDQLEAKGIALGDALDDNRIWYCADELVIRPNTAEDFRQLHDRAAVSDAALRSSAGADEADAPSRDEQVRAIGLKIQNAWLSTFGIDGQADFDWDKINGTSDTPGPAPGPQDKSTDPGSPNDNKSDTPKSQRPGS